MKAMDKNNRSGYTIQNFTLFTKAIFFPIWVMSKIMKHSPNRHIKVICSVLVCSALDWVLWPPSGKMKLEHQSGGSFFMFYDHFVTLWLNYFWHDPYVMYVVAWFTWSLKDTTQDASFELINVIDILIHNVHPTPKESIHFPVEYSKCMLSRVCNWLEGQPIRGPTWPGLWVLTHQNSKCILSFGVECILYQSTCNDAQGTVV